jgi:hypothetical protein
VLHRHSCRCTGCAFGLQKRNASNVDTNVDAARLEARATYRTRMNS